MKNLEERSKAIDEIYSLIKSAIEDKEKSMFFTGIFYLDKIRKVLNNLLKKELKGR